MLITLTKLSLRKTSFLIKKITNSVKHNIYEDENSTQISLSLSKFIKTVFNICIINFEKTIFHSMTRNNVLDLVLLKESGRL